MKLLAVSVYIFISFFILINIFFLSWTSSLFYYTFERKKNYLIDCINKTTNYIVSWLFTKKKHHARYVCQSVLYNGESRNSNYDDLLWVHGPLVGDWRWQRAGGGTSSKNRLELPLIYIYIYIYISYLPTPPLGQDMTQGQFFLSGV